MATIRRGRDGENSHYCIEKQTTILRIKLLSSWTEHVEQASKAQRSKRNFDRNLGNFSHIFRPFGLNFGGFWTGWRKARAATLMPRQRVSKRSSIRTPAPPPACSRRNISPVLSVLAPGSRAARQNGGRTAENGREMVAEKNPFMNFIVHAGYWRWIPVGTSSRQRCRRRCGPSVRKPRSGFVDFQHHVLFDDD